MAAPQFFLTPGYGERQLKHHYYSQAVRIGNRVETSGQGGWNADYQFPDALADQIAQAFDNLTATLAAAGADWSQVVSVTSYHVDFGSTRDEVNRLMPEHYRRLMPDHAPIWTALGVDALGEPAMRVEISVVAVAVD